MGWIWVLFLVFSVLGNILDKLAKEQKSSGPVKPDKDGDQPLPPDKPFSSPFPFPPFVMDELEGERRSTETLPKVKPDLTPSTPPSKEKTAPTDRPRHLQEQKSLMTEEEWDRLFGQLDGFDGEDIRVSSFTDGDEVEDLEDPDGWEIGAPLLYDALVLAHVLPRPDFRTVPWRRRL